MNIKLDELSIPEQRHTEVADGSILPTQTESGLDTQKSDVETKIEEFRSKEEICTPDEWLEFVHLITPTNTIKEMFGLRIVQLCAPGGESDACVRIVIKKSIAFKPYDVSMILTHYIRNLARERVAICSDAKNEDPLVLRLALKKGERLLTSPLEGTVVQERFDTRLKQYR
jgi:hypothetical protein